MLEVEVRARLGGFALDARFTGASKGVTVLFGPSGAGKSSVLAAVAGALKPQAGRIALDGEVLFDSAAAVDAPMERRRIGWVFQDARLFPHLSVEDNLRFGLKRAPPGRCASARWRRSWGSKACCGGVRASCPAASDSEWVWGGPC